MKFFTQSPFKNHEQNIQILQSEFVFVSDMFIDDYVGGAELTTDAIITSCPKKLVKIRSKDVTQALIRANVDKHWIFGNFSSIDHSLIPQMIQMLDYSIIEYDYKYCQYRSPQKHVATTGICNCHNEKFGQMIASFFAAARSLWWMSKQQYEWYLRFFPFLGKGRNRVLSSVFDDKTLDLLCDLRKNSASLSRRKWIVLGSDSWVKGAQNAVDFCEKNRLPHEIVWNIPYVQLLEKLAESRGLVYLPSGADTCPRMVIEAKLLGCELHLNDFVQHIQESWFNQSVEKIDEYLRGSKKRFWDEIVDIKDHIPTISGYTTTLNCIEQEYPFEESISSILAFSDEVVVVDGGSVDGTWDRLCAIATDDPRIKIHQQKRDWSAPRFAVFDGMQKALARSLCTKEFCWQMDSDEIVHENDVKKIKQLVKKFPLHVDLFALPVVEYWGGPEKVRIDINPWKWRLSRNVPNITHGIPKHLRKFDENGQLYSMPGSDGCDYVFSDSYEVVPFITFVSQEITAIQQSALAGDVRAIEQYNKWLSSVLAQLPSVHHFSWFNLERKIKTYKNYWSAHWSSLFASSRDDTAANNMMFDCPWHDVTDDMIKQRASEMKDLLGGWIWHRKWDGKIRTPHIKLSFEPPTVMLDWIRRNV